MRLSTSLSTMDNEHDSHFLLVPKYLLIVIGIWPEVNSFKIVYLIYSVLFQSYFFIFMFTYIVKLAIVAPTMPSMEVSDTLTFLLVYLLGIWKLWLFKRKSLKQLIKDVKIFEKTLTGNFIISPFKSTIYYLHD